MTAAVPKPAVILLAEDEALIRMMAAEVLAEEGGCRALEARTADEALGILDMRPDVRLLFTDVDMPGSLNGYALARIVDMRWPGIGLLVTSGKERPGPGALPKKARFLPKPYSPAALLNEVNALLGGLSGPTRAGPPAPADAPGAAAVPGALKLDQPHMGIGLAGGLAQPLSGPEE